VEKSELTDSSGWDDDSIMTSGEVARFLKVHLGSVRRWTRSGELKGYRLGKRGDWRYLRKDVIAFLHEHESALYHE
jgi:excisionase family DNA binding protein